MTMPAPPDLHQAVSSLRLDIRGLDVQSTLLSMCDAIQRQETVVEALRRELVLTKEMHAAELHSLRQDFQSKLNYCIDHVAAAVEALRVESAAFVQRAMPDAGTIPAMTDRLRRLEDFVETQVEFNAQSNVDKAAIIQRLEASSLSKLPSSSFYNSKVATSVSSSSMNDSNYEIAQLRKDVDDLLLLWSIPVGTASQSRRSLTSSSLHQAAHSTGEQRVKFLHSLPAFDTLWTELFRLNQRVSNPAGLTPARVRGEPMPSLVAEGWDVSHHSPERSRTAAAAAGGGGGISSISASPSSSLYGASRGISDSGAAASVFIKQLQADVAGVDGRRGAAVVRMVRGGLLETAGLMVGDTITHVDSVAIAGAFHLLDTLNDLEAAAAATSSSSSGTPSRNHHNSHASTLSCQLSVIPAGRANSIPVLVRIPL